MHQHAPRKNCEQRMNTSNPAIAKKDKEHIEFIRRMPSWLNSEKKKSISINHYLKRMIIQLLKSKKKKQNETKTTYSPKRGTP